MIYLASPYTNPDAAVREARYDAICSTLVRLVKEHPKEVFYSSIAHWHPIAVNYNLPVDHEFWLFQDKGMLEKANALWVVKLNGWERSKGIAEEVAFARQLNIPVDYV